MTRIMTVLMVTALLSGCAGGALMRQSMLVEPGQTKQQVMEAMGTPGDRQFLGDREAWQYCRTGIGTDQFVVVWFRNSKTTGVTTYKAGQNAGYIGDCNQGFRTVRWEDAPDWTVEVRQR